MFYYSFVDEDLVRLRRSLAMAPSLPADQIQQLLDEVERLRRTRREMADELEAIAAQIEQLRRRVSPRSSET
jgi:uncharacterized coiled-coil DUF342 family protein